MFKKIENSAACEMRSVIRFLNAKNMKLAEILCVQLKRRSERTDDSPLRHFPCIFLKFHCHFFTKLCLVNLSFGNYVIHYNVRPHTAAATQNLITTFGWEQFDHPPYSPDLAPSDFHLFLYLKSFLAGRRLHDNEVKEAVTTCFASQATSFYDEGIQKLVQRYDKCLNNGGNYVEK